MSNLLDSPFLISGETKADHRRRMEALEAEAVARRKQELSEERSPLNTPADRIGRWERRHQLQLPLSPGHRLVNIIAFSTGLDVEEVQAEQRTRAALKVRAPTA